MTNGHMMLIKRICDHLRRPVFEVLKFPASELEFWSLSFSITDDPKLPAKTADEVTVAESKEQFKEVWG